MSPKLVERATRHPPNSAEGGQREVGAQLIERLEVLRVQGL